MIMKKIIPLFALGIASFGSCISDKPTSESSLTFHIKSDDLFLTRSELYSSDAIQSIDDVKVYVFKTTDGGATYQYHKTYDLAAEWLKGNNSVVHNVTRTEMLEDGSYRFLAVGMDAPTDYTVQPPMTAGSTNYSNVYASLGSTVPQELFTGVEDNVIDSSIENVTILMTRRVAGVLGYFSNVPTTVGTQTVRYLRLTLAASNITLDITADPAAGVAPHPATEPGYNIFNVDLSTQGTSNGVYTGTPDIGGVAKTANTTLVGAHVVPVAFATGATMTLSLVADDGTTILKSWQVRDDTGNTTFNLLPNHFYSLGRKLQSANTPNGENDTNPEDDDMPIDLSKMQTITANILAGWNTVHQISLQDTP
jgi:hypothetical protein